MPSSHVSKQRISGFLERARALACRHEARRAAMYGVTALAGLVFVLPLLGRLVGGNRATSLAVIAFGGLAAVLVVVAAVVLGVVVPRKKYASDRAMARWVGKKQRTLASDLLSSVELGDAPARPGSPSTDLVDALLVTTSQRLAGVDTASLVDRAEVVRARNWALVAVVANVIVLAVAPRFVVGGWRELVALPTLPYGGAQLSMVPLVGDLEARLDYPAYAHRAPLTLPSASGDVRGLPGTTVTLHARVLVPASSVELVIESPSAGAGDAPPAGDAQTAAHTITVTLAGDQLSAKLVIGEAARYRFAITSPSGQRSIETTTRAIETEPDQPPSVQLMAPGEPLDVTNLRRVELAYVIEDDFGLTSAELVWEGGRDRGKKPIAIAAGSRAQGKFIWDIAELARAEGEVRYWIEAKDNDTVGDANVGRSREFHLRVVSPRERHEETLGRQQDVAEKVLKNLAGRLVLGHDEAGPRDDLARQLKEAIVELGAIAAAFEKDPYASDAMRKALAQMRDRLERLATAEHRITAALRGKPLRGAYAGVDPPMVRELEDDTLVLADWLDRERVEGLLDISDEIASHQKRLADLLAQYQRTKDKRLQGEIEREMRALDKAFAELEAHRRGMPEDVLDQYVHQNAVQAHQGASCVDAVRDLVRAGQIPQAQQKLESCRAQHERASTALEGSLAGLRGDKFSDEQKKLDEVMNELADVARDQDDIAAEANRIFEAYAHKADEVAKENRREASKKVEKLVDKLRKKIRAIDETGLTPFAKEELDIVERRLADVEHMAADGDIAEALGMAHQAKQSLDTIASELEAALEDDPKSKWADATSRALDDVERVVPVAKELIAELQALAPRPDKIMSGDDLRALERLRRREAMNRERTRRLAERSRSLAPELPGDTGEALAKRLGGAVQQMSTADDRMKAKDPSGTREATRAAADALAKARERARSAARQAQEGAVADEPIRIPGADEYRAPERFREDLLEAMKKKSAQGLDGYDDMLKRYYEDLIK